jgi:hypothetical protein
MAQIADQRKPRRQSARQSREKKRKQVRRDQDSALTHTIFHLGIFVIAFVIVCSRRPDVILNPQFYAEDGAYWFAQAYQFGWHSLLITQSSYLHTLTRIVALLTLLFPFSYAPLIMNLSAITVQILPVNVLLSSRFADIGLRTRLLASFLYLALPNSFETSGNITNLFWRLTISAFLLLIVREPDTLAWKIFDATVLVLTSIDGPIGILLVPVAAALWWTRRRKWQTATLWLLAPGALLQAITGLVHLQSRQPPHLNLAGHVVVNGGPNGATFGRLISILGGQIFFSSVLGLAVQRWVARGPGTFVLDAVAAALGLGLLFYALRAGPLELKLGILFALGVLTLSLWHPLVGTADRGQWDWLCIPGFGNRYFFLPMLAFLAALLWLATHPASRREVRYLAIALLLLLPVGICEDWSYGRFIDFHFQKYAERFESAPSGSKVTIPINPDWRMELTKR